MGEGIAVLLGAVVGGGCSLIGTYFTLRFHSKIEIKKLSLSFLMGKKSLIENLIDRCSAFDYSGNMEEDEGNVIDEYKIISEFIYQKSHYFIESDEFKKLQNSLSHIENDKEYSPLERVYQENFFNREFHKFIRNDLEATMIQISKELRN